MQAVAPHLWHLVVLLLQSPCKQAAPASTGHKTREEDREMDLGEFGGDEADLENKGKKAHCMQARETLLWRQLKLWFASSFSFKVQIQVAIICKKVVEVLAHAGLSLSLSSISNAVTSMSSEISSRIKHAVRSLKSVFAYDNFDINFKMSQPTLQRQTTFISATSATTVPLFGVEDEDALR
ncbi:hypothetical protein EDB19DRAFT_1836153 [Suillus lakei]|nr:hypothetical protein EDB19DRAFT_1836153 [Suillus lakei]